MNPESRLLELAKKILVFFALGKTFQQVVVVFNSWRQVDVGDVLQNLKSFSIQLFSKLIGPQGLILPDVDEVKLKKEIEQKFNVWLASTLQIRP